MLTGHRIPDDVRDRCPVCAEPLPNAVADISPLYCRCSRCHVVFRRSFRRVPAEDWDSQYFSDDLVLRYYDRRRSAFKKIVSLMDARVPERGKWLDIGCGPGVLLAIVSERGWQAHGIEQSGRCVEMIRSTLGGVQITLGAVPEKLEGFSGYTVVSLVDVLRSLAEPGKVLSLLRNVLAPGGWVLVREVSADAHSERRRRAVELDRPRFSTFSQVFSPRALEIALILCGFGNITSFPSPLFIESGGGERRHMKGLGDRLNRITKSLAEPVFHIVHRLSGGRFYLGRNFLVLAQNPMVGMVDAGGAGTR